MFGFLNINKPSGPTSHDVVAQVRRRLGRGVKVGHTGTLDPFADGVLVLCVGPATRLAERVAAGEKRYRATVTLGATSDTDDVEGRITPSGTAPPAREKVEAVLPGFVGQIEQVPPAHSAVHVNGRRAYKLARAGRPAELPTRSVVVHELTMLRYEPPELEIDARCGGGTYIRALARDIGRDLGCGGYCSKLTRMQVGPFRLSDAVGPEHLDPQRDLLDPLCALEGIPRVLVEAAAARRIANGNSVPLPEHCEPGEVAVIDGAGNLLALAEVSEDNLTLRPRRVFICPRA
ncbi:MAG: tRNA pseudouridine(55) synthase TruB [Phycisphaerae bacterium]